MEQQMEQKEWLWPITPSQQSHDERIALLRPIKYEITWPIEEQPIPNYQGRALSLNISSGGMLVLMDQEPEVEQVVKVYVPTPIAEAETPTLAEVRWKRPLPFTGKSDRGTYFVGLKFMF